MKHSSTLEGGNGALLIVDALVWNTLPEAHKIASNTASFSFVTNMEGNIQNLDPLETTPAMPAEEDKCKHETHRTARLLNSNSVQIFLENAKPQRCRLSSWSENSVEK